MPMFVDFGGTLKHWQYVLLNICLLVNTQTLAVCMQCQCLCVCADCERSRGCLLQVAAAAAALKLCCCTNQPLPAYFQYPSPAAAACTFKWFQIDFWWFYMGFDGNNDFQNIHPMISNVLVLNGFLWFQRKWNPPDLLLLLFAWIYFLHLVSLSIL